MLVFKDPQKLQRWALKQREAGVRIGLVPTMGYLHEGHLSLITAAKKYADAVVVSVFVNPIQFGPNEDYEKYPRDEKADLAKCKSAGAAAVFLPTPQTMYAPDASVHVTEEVLANRLCGLRRPGHFRGVCTVVAKLFNLAQPQVAVFGQKDFQQACVIRRMVRDLNFPIRIVVAPIVREPDGLARSSRNTYLSEEERCRAVGLSQSLCLAKRLFREGQTSAKRIVSNMTKSLEKDGLQVDYVEIVDAETLDPVKTVQKGNAVLLAVYDGKTRLIDNCLIS